MKKLDILKQLIDLIEVTQKFSWRRKWQPTPVILPGESHGRRSMQAAVHGIAIVRHDLVLSFFLPRKLMEDSDPEIKSLMMLYWG